MYLSLGEWLVVTIVLVALFGAGLVARLSRRWRARRRRVHGTLIPRPARRGP